MVTREDIVFVSQHETDANIVNKWLPKMMASGYIPKLYRKKFLMFCDRQEARRKFTASEIIEIRAMLKRIAFDLADYLNLVIRTAELEKARAEYDRTWRAPRQ
ncbi:MAG: hypothetical protein WC346_15140 [Methanogenium sp.]|jgi:hypothetical protein